MAKAFICVLKQNSHYFSSPLKKNTQGPYYFHSHSTSKHKTCHYFQYGARFFQTCFPAKGASFLVLIVAHKGAVVVLRCSAWSTNGISYKHKDVCMFGASVAQWHDGMWVVWRRDKYMSVSHEVFWEKEEIFADKNLDCKKKSWLWNSVFCHERCSPLMHDASWSGKYYYD